MAAWLAHQSGGLGVPSSNLGAPTRQIKGLRHQRGAINPREAFGVTPGVTADKIWLPEWPEVFEFDRHQASGAASTPSGSSASGFSPPSEVITAATAGPPVRRRAGPPLPWQRGYRLPPATALT